MYEVSRVWLHLISVMHVFCPLVQSLSAHKKERRVMLKLLPGLENLSVQVERVGGSSCDGSTRRGERQNLGERLERSPSTGPEKPNHLVLKIRD